MYVKSEVTTALQRIIYVKDFLKGKNTICKMVKLKVQVYVPINNPTVTPKDVCNYDMDKEKYPLL